MDQSRNQEPPRGRSKLFWSGLIGLIFISGLWVDSIQMERSISCRWSMGGRYLGLGFHTAPHRLGGWFGRPYSGFGNPFQRTGLEVFSEAVRPFQRENPRGPWEASVQGSDRARFRYSIDFWFIALCYLPPWLGLLWWWQRRKAAYWAQMRVLAEPPSGGTE